MKKNNSKRSARKSPKKVKILQGNKNITTQSGLIPAVKFLLNKLKFKKLTQETIDHERGDTAKYDAFDAIFLTVAAVIAGARAKSAIPVVWADAVLRRIAGWDSIPDETTFGRLFRTFKQRHVNQIETLVHRVRQRAWQTALRDGKSSVAAQNCHVIDVDSTEKTAYGKQEGVAKGYNPHKRGRVSYHPLLAFCTETKEILQGWLRCGNAYTSNGVVEFTKQLLAHLPGCTRIIFRGDSGFFGGALLDLLEEGGHGYLIKVKLKGLVKLLSGQAWEKTPNQSGWEQCDFLHQCGTWKVTRRFVAVRREKPKDPKKAKTLFEIKEYDYFCYVISEELTPWSTHKSYGQRATCETWIEEAKNQMALAHIKTDDFWANSVLFQCAILAYNTVRWMALCSGDKLLRRWEPATIRTFIIRTAGKLTTGSRQLKLHVTQWHLYDTQWNAWVEVGMS